VAIRDVLPLDTASPVSHSRLTQGQTNSNKIGQSVAELLLIQQFFQPFFRGLAHGPNYTKFWQDICQLLGPTYALGPNVISPPFSTPLHMFVLYNQFLFSFLHFILCRMCVSHMFNKVLILVHVLTYLLYILDMLLRLEVRAPQRRLGSKIVKLWEGRTRCQLILAAQLRTQLVS